MESRVKLNVGGICYETTLETLRKHPGTCLDRLSRNCIKDGHLFIDRNGILFESVLEFLRTGEIFVPPYLSQAAVQRELEFFELPRTDQRSSADAIEDIVLRSATNRHGKAAEFVCAKVSEYAKECAEALKMEFSVVFIEPVMVKDVGKSDNVRIVRVEDKDEGKRIWNTLNREIGRQFVQLQLLLDFRHVTVTHSRDFMVVVSVRLDGLQGMIRRLTAQRESATERSVPFASDPIARTILPPKLMDRTLS